MTVVEIKYNDDRLVYSTLLDFKRIFTEVTGKEITLDLGGEIITAKLNLLVLEKFVQDGFIGRQRVKYSNDAELTEACQDLEKVLYGS